MSTDTRPWTVPGRCAQCGDCAEGFRDGNEYWHVHDVDCQAATDGTGRLMVHPSVAALMDDLRRLRSVDSASE